MYVPVLLFFLVSFWRSNGQKHPQSTPFPWFGWFQQPQSALSRPGGGCRATFDSHMATLNLLVDFNYYSSYFKHVGVHLKGFYRRKTPKMELLFALTAVRNYKTVPHLPQIPS